LRSIERTIAAAVLRVPAEPDVASISERRDTGSARAGIHEIQRWFDDEEVARVGGEADDLHRAGVAPLMFTRFR
jgi:hypothetical protein